jgi:hypothetical protein
VTLFGRFGRRRGTGLFEPETAFNAWILVRHGQSNSWGVNPGETGLSSLYRYFDFLLGTTPTSPTRAWRNIDGAHGSDFTLAKVMQTVVADGDRVGIINISKGATFASQWLPGNPVFTDFTTQLNIALGSMAAQFPGAAAFKFIQIRDQGEEEARSTLNPIPAAWENNTVLVMNAARALLAPYGQVGPDIVIQTNSSISGKTFPGLLEGLQLKVAHDPIFLVNRNPDQGVVYEGDGVHMTTAGYITNANLCRPALVAAVRQMLLQGKGGPARVKLTPRQLRAVISKRR